MKILIFFLKVLLLIDICLSANTNTVVPTCPSTDVICHTSLFLRWDRTSLSHPAGLIADGVVKSVMVYNESLPGPPIVVYEGQQVVVKVFNQLNDQGTTVHWHGVHQSNTPWMDGAQGISHCPINPGETFTYRFLAYPTGTHWYHSHYGTQRTMGAAGPFIILPKDDERQRHLRGSDPLPVFEKEFVLTVTDWMWNNSLDVNLMTQYEMVSFPFGYDSDYCFESTKQADGFDCGVYPFMSGLINGKGRYFVNGQTQINTPLEHFKVEEGKNYRFRVICTSMLFSFRLSIDNHELNVITSDGSDVITKSVESVIISSGERYDFWIYATDPQQTKNYWIRAETLEKKQNGKPIEPGRIQAILQYDDREDEPTTTRRECSATTPCKILNCPYQSYLEDQHMQCLHITDLQATKHTKTLQSRTGNFVEHFLNFHYVGVPTKGIWKPSVNGFMNVLPTNPYNLGGSFSKPCDLDSCTSTFCHCSHVLQVPFGSVVQLVLAITVSNPVGILNGMNHPIHLHGHNFQVIKIGFPSYNSSTNIFQSTASDIVCEDPSCNKLRWSDRRWENGNIQDALKFSPPRKDTVLVPVGGYVVIRFKAIKPGYWYMHCHIEFHNTDGMSLVIKEGTDEQMAEPPAALSTCGDFLQGVHDVHDDSICPESTGHMLLYIWTTGAMAIYLLALIWYQICRFQLGDPNGVILQPVGDRRKVEISLTSKVFRNNAWENR